MNKKKISEKNLSEFLSVVIKHDKEITLQNFVKKVEGAFDLSEEDLKYSKTRPNEQVYVQRCRNLISHKTFPEEEVYYENETFKQIKKKKVKKLK